MNIFISCLNPLRSGLGFNALASAIAPTSEAVEGLNPLRSGLGFNLKQKK